MNSTKAQALATEFAATFGGNGLTTKQQIDLVAERLIHLGPSGTERRICEDIEERQQHGIRKYGVSVQNNPLSHQRWLQHAYEEALDLAIYLRRALEEIT